MAWGDTRRALLIIALVHAGWILLLFSPALLRGLTPLPHTSEQHYSRAVEVQRQVVPAGDGAAWSPRVLGGMPGLSTPVCNAYGPTYAWPHLGAALGLPAMWTYTIALIAGMWLLAWATSALLLTAAGPGRAALAGAVVGGAAVPLAGWFWRDDLVFDRSVIEHLMTLPLALLAVELIHRRREGSRSTPPWAAVGLGALGLGLCPLNSSGGPHSFAYSVAWVLVWIALRAVAGRRHRDGRPAPVGTCLVMVGLGLAVAMPALVVELRAVADAARIGEEGTLTFHPVVPEQLGSILPDLWPAGRDVQHPLVRGMYGGNAMHVGWLVAALAVVGAACSRRAARAPLLAWAVLGLLALPVEWLVMGPLGDAMPAVLTVTHHGLYSMWILPFGAAGLAALGVAALGDRRPTGMLRRVVVAAGWTWLGACAVLLAAWLTGPLWGGPVTEALAERLHARGEWSRLFYDGKAAHLVDALHVRLPAAALSSLARGAGLLVLAGVGGAWAGGAPARRRAVLVAGLAVLELVAVDVQRLSVSDAADHFPVTPEVAFLQERVRKAGPGAGRVGIEPWTMDEMRRVHPDPDWPTFRDEMVDWRRALNWNRLSVHGIHQVHGLDNLVQRPTARFLGADPETAPHLGHHALSVPDPTTPAMRLLGMRWHLSRTDPRPTARRPDVLREAFRGPVYTVWERTDALPRAWWTPGVITVADDGAAGAALFGDDPVAPRAAAVVTRADRRSAHAGPLPGAGPPADAADADARVTWLEERDHLLRLSVTADRPGVMVVSDAWGPGWRARVDGRPAPLLRVNLRMRGVPVPAGTSEVRMVHVPSGWWLLRVIGAVTAVLCAAAALGGARRLWKESD